MLRASRGLKKTETLTKIPIDTLGLGHATRIDPNKYQPGYSHRTYDVNLDIPGSERQRSGIRYICENPIGAQQITAFEEAIGAGVGQWSVPVFGALSNDVVLFREFEIGGPGTMGKRLTAAGAGTPQSDMTLAAPLDLGADTQEFIAFWLYVDTLSNWTEGRFVMLNNALDRFLFRFAPVASATAQGVSVGWNLMVKKKADFTVENSGMIGDADWSNITSLRITADTQGACGFTFDNAFVAPKQTDGLYQFKQSPAKGGGTFILGAARGIVAYLDFEQRRWVPLVPGLTPYRKVRFETFTDWCYFCNGAETVKVCIGDGAGAISAATTYDAGIEAPAETMTYEVQDGGTLPVGLHQYRLEYVSSITGLPGNSTALDIPATSADVKIVLSNIPVPTDPKVTSKILYRRDATESRFYKVAELAVADVTYLDNVASLDKTKLLLGFPTYLLNSPPPRLSMLRVIAGRLCGAGDPDAPGVFYPSRPGNGEQWDLAAGPTALDSGDNDVITAVFDAYDGNVGVGKARAVHIGTAISGPAAFAFRKRAPKAGPSSHDGVVVSEDAIRYPSHDGWYAMSRGALAGKISRMWDTGPAAPGVIEPTFRMLDNGDPSMISGAYLKALGQILWTCKMLRDPGQALTAVYHVGHLEGAGADADGSGAAGGWAFHRYAKGHALEGANCLAEYVDGNTGKVGVLMAGPGGFVYELDSGEIDDELPGTTRVAIVGNVLHAFYGTPGVALGPHQMKDYARNDLIFVPMGNWPVDLRYYYDWRYLATAGAVTPVGSDVYSFAAQPLLGPPEYAEIGTIVEVPLPSGRHHSIAVEVINDRLGQAFHLSESVWYLEYLGAEGAL